jgi:hypothetical protein
MDAPPPLRGKLMIVSRRDEDEVSRIREGIDSLFWEALRTRIGRAIADARQTLETSTDQWRIARAQGAVEALNRVLRMPEQAMKERKLGSD